MEQIGQELLGSWRATPSVPCQMRVSLVAAPTARDSRPIHAGPRRVPYYLMGVSAESAPIADAKLTGAPARRSRCASAYVDSPGTVSYGRSPGLRGSAEHVAYATLYWNMR